jgi:hypothetical protein
VNQKERQHRQAENPDHRAEFAQRHGIGVDAIRACENRSVAEQVDDHEQYQDETCDRHDDFLTHRGS